MRSDRTRRAPPKPLLKSSGTPPAPPASRRDGARHPLSTNIEYLPITPSRRVSSVELMRRYSRVGLDFPLFCLRAEFSRVPGRRLFATAGFRAGCPANGCSRRPAFRADAGCPANGISRRHSDRPPHRDANSRRAGTRAGLSPSLRRSVAPSLPFAVGFARLNTPYALHRFVAPSLPFAVGFAPLNPPYVLIVHRIATRTAVAPAPVPVSHRRFVAQSLRRSRSPWVSLGSTHPTRFIASSLRLSRSRWVSLGSTHPTRSRDARF